MLEHDDYWWLWTAQFWAIVAFLFIVLPIWYSRDCACKV